MSMESKMKKLAEMRELVDKPAAAKERLSMLFDDGTFNELDAFTVSENAGVITGFGYIEGNPVYAFSQDVTVDGGAVGRVHAAKVNKVYQLALKTGCPVIGIYDSNGARLSEGYDAMAAYGEMLAKSNNLSGVVPQIALVLGTCAGISAMLASSADFCVMSKKAQLFLTAPFVAEAKGEGVQGAGTAENAAKAGVASIVAEDDNDAIEQARKLISLLPTNNLSAVPVWEYAEPEAALSAESCAKTAAIGVADADSVVELSKEYAENVFTALATVGGSTVGLVAVSGEICPYAASKAARFVRVCDAFNVPVVTFVDTNGFIASSKAELSGGIQDAAKLAHAYAEATCPKISVITGKAYGAAYVAFAGRAANSDVTIAWPTAVISALSPETSVEFFWHDKLKGAENVAAKRAELAEEYAETEASPFAAAKAGVIEDVIDPAQTRSAVLSALDMLSSKRVSKLPKKHGNMPF